MLRDTYLSPAICETTNDPATFVACQNAGIPTYAPTQDSQSLDVQACIDAGNVQTAPIDAKAQNLAQTWIPFPTYSSDQVRSIVEFTQSVISQAQSAVDQSIAQLNGTSNIGDAASNLYANLQQATDDLTRHGAQANDYLQAANQADSLGMSAVVAAPNIKQWVLNAINASSNAMVAAYAVSCVVPGWSETIKTLVNSLDAGVQILAATVQVITGLASVAGQTVVAAVETVAATATGTFSLVAWLAKYWPLLGGTVVLVGGFFLYRKYKRVRNLFMHHEEET